MKKVLFILVICAVLLFGTAFAGTETVYGNISLQELQSLERQYPDKVSIHYYSHSDFMVKTKLSTAEAKKWVFLIDFDKDYIAMSDSNVNIIAYIASNGSLQYCNDCLALRINLLESIGNLISKEKKLANFSLLTARNAKKANVSYEISSISDTKDKIDLSSDKNRKVLLDTWESDKSVSNGLSELGGLLSLLDTNGNGQIDPEELFGY